MDICRFKGQHIKIVRKGSPSSTARLRATILFLSIYIFGQCFTVSVRCGHQFGLYLQAQDCGVFRIPLVAAHYS